LLVLVYLGWSAPQQAARVLNGRVRGDVIVAKAAPVVLQLVVPPVKQALCAHGHAYETGVGSTVE
jgi:hypothetical protein